ncbi:porin [Variovorax sp. J22G73]|uniref:porin n=1 Tax=unclassified Variovorax TaxID=663243 RepID=UPI0025791286|nr:MULTISPECIES: porin [unclassified Variovorax]MDM0004580.1 porin [Variovorax sp. J22R203]MDM0095754.1 porin [Variovorax sp. J22G73]
MAALAVAGVASAQSSVTLFGVVDASISGYSSKSQDLKPTVLRNDFRVPTYTNQGSVKVSRTALASSAYNSSRLGFRGTEDLGGGLAASFWLEAPITNDDGATGISTFARRSTVSLSGGFGEIRLGRDYTPTFWNDTVFDPFGTNGVGTNLISSANGFNVATNSSGGFAGNQNYVRASNSIGYFLPPNLGGFYGQVMYAFHENDKYKNGDFTPATGSGFVLNAKTGAIEQASAAKSRTGRYVGGRFGYANGPLDVALAYGNSTVGDQYYPGTTDAVKTFNLGASYDFGPAKLFGELSRAKNSRDYEVTPILGGRPDVDLKGYLLGVTVPVGAGLIRASFSSVKYDYNLPVGSTQRDPKANKLALGYVHNLSKRTALYTTVARVSNKNGAALTVGGPAFTITGGFTPKTSTGYDFGIRHAF